MSVTLNTQLEELLFSSQIIYTWRRLSHQSKLYGVRLAQVFPTRHPRRLHSHLRHRVARHQLMAGDRVVKHDLSREIAIFASKIGRKLKR